MKVLVRQYVNNGDKSNKIVNTIDEALEVLGMSLNEVHLVVSWLNNVDLFFRGTNDYLRVIN
jgi:hypothetical protein